MFNRLIQIFVIVLCLVNARLTYANGDDDLQSWISFTWEGHFQKATSFYVSEQIKFGQDISQLYLHRPDVGLMHEFGNRFEVRACYKHVYILKNGLWELMRVPHFDALISWNWLGIDFENRNKFEYRMVADDQVKPRYRFRLKLTPNIKITSLAAEPYFYHEFFYDRKSKVTIFTRTAAGLDIDLSRFMSLKLFYLFQRYNPLLHRHNYHVLGTEIKISY